MGFTVEDMLIIARDKYKMELVAGRNGWANSISWLLMVEDTTIMENFKGKELAVTMGAGSAFPGGDFGQASCSRPCGKYRVLRKGNTGKRACLLQCP